MKFSMKDSSENVPTPQETADLITFAEEIFNGKLHCVRSIKGWLTHFVLMFTFDPSESIRKDDVLKSDKKVLRCI